MNELFRLGPRPAPSRFPVHRPFRIERSDRCINCGTCITACTYGCHERSTDDPREMAPPLAACCRSCFACILRCPRAALSMHENEEYRAQGRGVCSPDKVRVILEEAEQGKIPVSGSGYGGPFDGVHFDNIWTDMSEIVRPTRDGIHGRERISTQVALGRMLPDLCGLEFDEQGHLRSHIPPMREISLPILFGLSPHTPGHGFFDSMALAATRITTYATVRADRDEDLQRVMEYFNHLIVRLEASEVESRRRSLEWASIIELDAVDGCLEAVARARSFNPHILSILRVPAGPEAAERVLGLARQGAETVHLHADARGLGCDGGHLIAHLRAVHLRLIEEGVRDRVTLIASGGIVAAEHVPKAIIVGADAVAVDLPLLIALECGFCGDCTRGQPCPRGLGEIDPRWGATRIINLMLSWRDQLLEVLGAMGLRDVRRLRGETGRAIFANAARESFVGRLRLERETTDEPPGPRPPEAPTARDEPRPWRFSTPLAAYRVEVDRQRCTACGLCVESCRNHVHRRPEGRLALEEPAHERCIGPTCLEQNDWCCVRVCPWDAVRVTGAPVSLVLGDRRWTPALLRSTWRQARTGVAPGTAEAALTGASGGGFDSLQLGRRDVMAGAAGLDPAEVDLSLSLNRRGEGPEIVLPLPVYGGGMSYGSIALQVMQGRAMAAKRVGTFTCTGEGGYPDELIPYSDHVITQIATGLFGVREETIQRARMVEFKYAQGAKPGLGGHLLGEKNTPRVAAMRQAVPGTSLFSPFPFHSVYSVEDHKKHLDWIRAVSPETLISVKVSTAADVDMVAVGSYYAGANVVHLDGSYGGTGAAPDIAKKNIAQPIEYGVSQAHDFLVKEGIRDRIVLIASGGVRTAIDALKAIALGADGVVIGTAELVAVDCVRCGNCERGRGCPIGIATTDAMLSRQMTAEFVRDRIVNLYACWAATMRRCLADLGLASVAALRGRRDLLRLRPRGES